MRALIVDDERSARNVLGNLLEQCCPEIDVVGTSSNVQEAIEQINQLNPDVVFLDVQMPNYAGYEIINFLKEINFEIIFVTAFDQYAMKAFELSAIDYLIKPIDRSLLIKAVRKLKTRVNEQNKLIEYSVLLDSMKKREVKQIVIPELGDRRVVDLDSIVAIEADGSYSTIHLVNKQQIIVSKAIKYFESVLLPNTVFFRSHRTWIIGLKHLKTFNKTTNSAYLTGDLIAKVSRKKLDEFEKIGCRIV